MASVKPNLMWKTTWQSTKYWNSCHDAPKSKRNSIYYAIMRKEKEKWLMSTFTHMQYEKVKSSLETNGFQASINFWLKYGKRRTASLSLYHHPFITASFYHNHFITEPLHRRIILSPPSRQGLGDNGLAGHLNVRGDY